MLIFNNTFYSQDKISSRYLNVPHVRAAQGKIHKTCLRAPNKTPQGRVEIRTIQGKSEEIPNPTDEPNTVEKNLEINVEKPNKNSEVCGMICY